MIPFIGDLTKIDPPTWGADVSDPRGYDVNSVGYWSRFGNLVWFSVAFIINPTSPWNNGSGNYYWAPALDGAPPIDSDIYNNTEGQAMRCGSALAFIRGQYRNGHCVIGESSSRIYAVLTTGRMSDISPFIIIVNEGFRITGQYATNL